MFKKTKKLCISYLFCIIFITFGFLNQGVSARPVRYIFNASADFLPHHVLNDSREVRLRMKRYPVASTVAPTAFPDISSPEALWEKMDLDSIAAISPENAIHLGQLARFGKGFVNDVEYSPDGLLMAVGTSLGVYLSDMRSSEEILYISTIESVEKLHFSPDSTKLAGAMGNKTIVEWDINNGQILQILAGIQAAYNADGNLIIIQIVDEMSRRISVYNVSSGVTILEIDNALRAYKFWDAFLFSPDASKLFIPGRNSSHTVEMFSLITGELLHEFDSIQEGGTWEMLCTEVNGMAISENGEYFAIGCVEYGNIFIWKMDGEFVKWINADIWAVDELALSPDGQLVVGALELGGVSLWRVSDGTRLQEMSSTHDTINDISFSLDGFQIIAGYGNGLVRQWRTSDGSVVKDLHDFTPTGAELAFSPEGDRLASVAGNGVQFIDVETGQTIDTLIAQILDQQHFGNRRFSFKGRSGPMGFIEVVIFSDDWQYLFTLKDDGFRYLWSVSDSRLLHVFDWGDSASEVDIVQMHDPVFAQNLVLYESPYGVLSPDWKFFVGFGEGSTGLLKNLDTDEVCDKFQLSTDPVFSANGELLAAPYGAFINIYNTEDCRLNITLQTDMRVSAVAFSPDGTLLASGSDDGSISLWDLADGSLLISTPAHTGFDYPYEDQVLSIVSGLSFSPDGRYLASGGAHDGSIRLWGILP